MTHSPRVRMWTQRPELRAQLMDYMVRSTPAPLPYFAALEQQMDGLMRDESLDDEQAFAKLGSFVRFLERDYPGEPRLGDFFDTGRAVDRSGLFTDLLPPGASARSLLDFGCADGSILAGIGEALGVEPNQRFGVDVRDIGDPERFRFVPADQFALIPDASIDIALSSVVLHHLDHAEEIVAGIHRVVKPGGYFILREHDSFDAERGAFFHAIHCLWGLVFRPNGYQQLHCPSLRGIDQWASLFESAGFKLLPQRHVSPTFTTTIVLAKP